MPILHIELQNIEQSTAVLVQTEWTDLGQSSANKTVGLENTLFPQYFSDIEEIIDGNGTQTENKDAKNQVQVAQENPQKTAKWV